MKRYTDKQRLDWLLRREYDGASNLFVNRKEIDAAMTRESEEGR
jgi:hypothetical protein